MPSESEIISLIRNRARESGEVLIGVGDDGAVIRGDDGKDLIACCDLMIEGVHFRTEWAPPRLIGRKALAVNLSDIAAMGGVPKFAMVSIALPRRFDSAFIDELFAGVFELADSCGVSIIGGDTSSSPDSLFIDVSVIGECESGKAVTRRGANSGDAICVSGSLGASALGLELLESGSRLDDSTGGVREPLMKHLAPEPRLGLGLALAEHGLATAMIDISDGLSTDLSHVLEESEAGAIIHAEAIPAAEAVRSRRDCLELALHGGEEYELLFTTSPARLSEVTTLSHQLSIPITLIGEIVPARGLQLEREGHLEPLIPQGHQHLI